MHLGNGAITPECVVLTVSAGAAGLAAAAAAARADLVKRDKLLLAAGLGALVFAAQAVNVPAWAGVSAHLVGGVLLASLLGPGLGACTMALVLAVQACLLGDGGVAALGANIVNMALLPAALVALAKGRSTIVMALLAGLSVPLAAGLIAIETALFRPAAELAGWSSFAALLIGTHLWIGVLEAGCTAGVIAALSRLTEPAAMQPRYALRTAAWCLAAALVLIAIWPLSSGLPDGYEASALASGQERLLAD